MRSTIYLVLVTFLSFWTYFFGYWKPPYVYWDENYHIASAQKYLHGVHFMENHPPLGKLLIAAGEKLIHPNPRSDQFLDTDYARDFPPGFSFAGYRFFPALLSWLTAPLLFLIFLQLCQRPFWAFALSSLYVFDNALIVHCRGAMLEGPFMFWMAGAIWLYFRLEDRAEEAGRWPALLFGASLALLVVTKVIGLILAPLVPFLLWRWRADPPRLRSFIARFVLGFSAVYLGVWYVHFAVARHVRPALEEKGYYQASTAYRELLDKGQTTNPLRIPLMLRDSFKFIAHYNRGVPRLNLCKPDENGSPFFMWPVGARSINLRWETPEGKNYRYLYLQCNPAIWLFGLLAVLTAGVLWFAPVFLPISPLSQRSRIGILLLLYGGYMGAMANLSRVMYLYHYFTPLFFSFILAGLCFLEIKKLGSWTLTESRKNGLLTGMLVLNIAVFLFYAPLTYYWPLSDAQVARRAWLPLWNLHSINGGHNKYLADPCKG